MKRSRAAPRWQTRHPEHRQPAHRLRPWSTRVFAGLARRRCDHNHQRVDPRRTPAMAGTPTPTPSRCPATDRETGARTTRLSKPHVRSRTAMWSDGVCRTRLASTSRPDGFAETGFTSARPDRVVCLAWPPAATRRSDAGPRSGVTPQASWVRLVRAAERTRDGPERNPHRVPDGRACTHAAVSRLQPRARQDDQESRAR